MPLPYDRDITQRTQVSPGPDAPSLHSACVVVIHGGGLGKRADVGDVRLIVGRSHDAGLHIPHPSVSRQHCEIWAEDGRYRVRDLGSTNRTRVNDCVIDDVDLVDGDHITIGESILKFIGHGSVEARYHEEVHQLARHDSLTGFSNRRDFLERLETEIARARHQPYPLSLAIVDIDHFKRINDAHGHLGGDSVLRQIARVMRDRHGADEPIGRIGGEEFAILFADVANDEVTRRCETLRAALEATPIVIGELQVPMTISIGIASLGAVHIDRPTLMRAADAALYRAKDQGRNRICVAD